jgi:hypothetical protein
MVTVSFIEVIISHWEKLNANVVDLGPDSIISGCGSVRSFEF